MEHTIVWQHIVLAILLVNALFASGLSTVTAKDDDDLDDFDFSDIDSVSLDAAVKEADLASTDADNLLTTEEDWEKDFNAIDGSASSHGYAFRYCEKTLREALAKALTNKTLRERFVEIMPILRVLTSQQRLALSALITTQVTARRNNPLKLAEVRSMFGDEKNLLLPIMFDIANLVSTSAFKYLPNENTTLDGSEVEKSLNRREFELSANEDEDEQQMLGIADMSEEILDPQSINEKLMEPMPALRQKRSIANEGEQLAHKLVRVAPLAAYIAEETKRDYELSRMLKINTTGFQLAQNNYTKTDASITDSNYQQLEDLALANLNGTFLAETAAEDTTTVQQTEDEELPTPEELISGPRYRLSQTKIRPVFQKAIRKRVQVQTPQKTRANAAAQLPLPRKCERFTASMCIRTDDYPL